MVDNKQLRSVTYLLSLLFAAVQGLLILLAPLLALKGEASWLEPGFQWRFEPASYWWFGSAVYAGSGSYCDWWGRYSGCRAINMLCQRNPR